VSGGSSWRSRIRAGSRKKGQEGVMSKRLVRQKKLVRRASKALVAQKKNVLKRRFIGSLS